MEKTLTIDGREVAFKANASLLLVYNSEFGVDALKELSDESYNNGAPALIIEMRLIYCMAKLADKSLPPMEDWYATFDDFPVNDIYAEVGEMSDKSLTMSAKDTASGAKKSQKKA